MGSLPIRRWLLLGFVVGIAVAGCSSDGGDRGPERPDPPEPALGDEIASVVIDDTEFRLHDQGDGCLAMEVGHPGMQLNVHRRCFRGDQVLDITDTCGWLAPEPEGDVVECDVELPAVLFGLVAEPAIGHVCVGTINDSATGHGVTDARFVGVGADGVILEPARPGEGPHAHLFTGDGIRYGDPPLDAPSDPIYSICEEQAPWGETGVAYVVDLLVSLGEALRRDEVTVFFETGAGSVGVSGGADEESMRLVAEVPAASAGVAVTVQSGDEERSQVYPWPEALQAVLDSGAGCPDLMLVGVTVGDDFLDGSDEAVEVTALSVSGCALG